ncbi:MAG TPA: 2OG-Fe(II) oxygenase [Tepidisphaeraceae bacterium]|nr:2OG-Fe(II) oxygenase [Tepidisphaeraceae bacterium]
MLSPGDPAPAFESRCSAFPTFTSDVAAGRYVVMCFFGSANQPASRRVLDDFEQANARFNVRDAMFCGISADPDDERLARVRQQWPGVIYFWDFDTVLSRAFDALPPVGTHYSPRTLILDPAMRVLAIVPFTQDVSAHAAQVLGILDRQPPVLTIQAFAPVLAIPYVFEPEFCRELIGRYETQGGRDIGMVCDVDGKTVRVHDDTHKRRTDCDVSDSATMAAVRSRLERRVFPAIRAAFQFHATQIERYLVACYDARDGGFFRAHRDDTSKGSAHRRFAITINLNAEQYEGGDLRFPEFGYRTYRAPTGGAIVFACSLLHEARPVTKGRRFAFLPFVYDEQAALIREANHKFLSAELTTPQPARS